MKKTLLILLVTAQLAGCAGQDSFANSTEGDFFNVSYPEIFVASYNGSELKLSGPYDIIFKSYRFNDPDYREIQSSIDSLSQVIGDKPTIETFPIDSLSCKKIRFAQGKDIKVAYVFWAGKWVGTARLSKPINDVQESLVDRIMGSLKKNEEMVGTKTKLYKSDLYEISIPDGWSGKVVNHFNLSMTKDMIANGAGSFDVSVITDTVTKDSLSWAQSYAQKAGWVLKTGIIKINGAKFTTFKNTQGNITTRIYCCCQDGKLAIMAYSVTSPVIERQAMEIAKGFRFK